MTRTRLRFGMSTLVVALGLLAGFAQQAAAASGGYNVLFLNAVNTSCLGDTSVQSQLAAQPGIAKVDPFNASTATPSVAQLEGYDMAVAHSDCNAYSDPAAIGNNLADYVDHGGVVVEYAYSMHSDPTFQIAGRWLSGGYSPYGTGTNVNNNVTLGAHDASSPLMAGVSNLASHCNTAATLASGATRVAQWNNAQEAVALKGRAVAVNASIDDLSCTASGDYARLTANAASFLSHPYDTLISKKRISRSKRKARFKFSATGHVTGFDCALGRKKKGKKLNLSFSACSSPKGYKHLKPGKYTFEVRGTNSGQADPIPAKKKFKI